MHGTTIFTLALVASVGVLTQWLAWRLRVPSIALLLAAGLVCGPLTGLVDPLRDFGAGYRPVVSLAVALILFEGGLTLNFREIRGVGTSVRRLIVFGAPLIGILTALAARWVAGLSWPTATVLGAILIVTGPTVVGPLLRQARLEARSAAILRWEAIVNDAVGALLAVVTFQVFLVFDGSQSWSEVAWSVLQAVTIGCVGGFGLGQAIGWSFGRGFVPEFLKLPLVVVMVPALYAAANLVLEESGLLAVTVLGVTLANSRIAILDHLRRFKETSAVILVSALFIVLTASLTLDDLRALDLSTLAFVGVVLFVVRPFAVFLVTTKTSTTWRERLLVGWVAPRGIVAVAVAGLFGRALTDYGIADGQRLLAFAFAVVLASIVAHGFSLGPLARALKLRSTEVPGVLIVGGSHFSNALGEKLLAEGVPVLVADTQWSNLKPARLRGVPVYYGEVLSENARHEIDFHKYTTVVAATHNHDYNALVCTDLRPEVGRDHVFELREQRDGGARHDLSFTLGGRHFGDTTLTDTLGRLAEGWEMRATEITETFGFDDFESTHPKALPLMWRRPDGTLESGHDRNLEPQAGDLLFSLGPASTDAPLQRSA